ncbi:MAG: hypothetical protein BBJ57_00845 [Desulfobacterales bacterium PC51MH44]|nr:MAG: hypothetical protein BBJ57_00845 [Desulfobacterales bacterium PC51MH44]
MACDLDILDLNNMTKLPKKVLSKTTAIPYRSVRSYGEIAERLGRPKAALFIGAAMARNPSL